MRANFEYSYESAFDPGVAIYSIQRNAVRKSVWKRTRPLETHCPHCRLLFFRDGFQWVHRITTNRGVTPACIRCVNGAEALANEKMTVPKMLDLAKWAQEQLAKGQIEIEPNFETMKMYKGKRREEWFDYDR